MGGGNITTAYLGFHGEPQDLWREASASRACYRGHILWMGPDVSSGCSVAVEQVKYIWVGFCFGSFMCALFFEKVPTVRLHRAVQDSGPQELQMHRWC